MRKTKGEASGPALGLGYAQRIFELLKEALFRLVNHLFPQGITQLLKQLFLLRRELCRCQNVDDHQLIAPSVSSQVGDPLASQPDNLSALRSGRDCQILVPIQRGHHDFVPQSCLGHIYVQFQQDVAVVPAEVLVLFDMQYDVQVAGRSASASRLALPGKADAGPIVHASRDLNSKGSLPLHDLLATALAAGRGYDLALTLAPGTGCHLHKGTQDCLLLAPYLTRTIALRAANWLSAWFGPTALAVRAGFRACDLDLLLTAKDGFFKLDGKIVPEISATGRSPPGRPSGTRATEKALKDIVNAAKTAKVPEPPTKTSLGS
jgi:hypothetical protein